jgi:type IV pilus assembly protein PilW
MRRKAMTQKRSIHHTSKSIRGFTLIELMVSLTIGLVIIVAAMSAYLGSAGASKISDAQTRMNEDAQAALNLLAHEIRMAGANPVQPGRDAAFKVNPVYSPYPLATATGTATYTVTPVTATVAAFSIRGCDQTFSNVIAASATNLDLLTCAGTSTLPDSIAINYEADRFNTTPTSTGATDCQGNGLSTITPTFTLTTTTATWTATGNGYWIVDNRFYIDNTAGIPSLQCKGNGNANGAPLVENIEDMQFLYGTMSTTATTTTATIAGYLSASEVDALAPSVALLPDRWSRVLSVRICVVVRSEKPAAPDAASASYLKCDGTRDTSKTDLRLRRAYTTIVTLRNRRF